MESRFRSWRSISYFHLEESCVKEKKAHERGEEGSAEAKLREHYQEIEKYPELLVRQQRQTGRRRLTRRRKHYADQRT